MKVIIAGSRSITDPFFVAEGMRAWKKRMPAPTLIVSGTAGGVDLLGEQWAAAHELPVHAMPADWKRHGKAAGPIRNEQMAHYAEGLVCIWDGISRGSQSMIRFMRDLRKPTLVIRLREQHLGPLATWYGIPDPPKA